LVRAPTPDYEHSSAPGAHLSRAVGDKVGWARELREALRINTQMNATGWMERIEQELAS